MCIIGASSAFTESTLAQIFKQKRPEGSYYGGPAYYIEQALHAPFLSILFCIFLISTYAFGFNMLCSYNLQSSFSIFSFYDPHWGPLIIGGSIVILVGICTLGNENCIVHITEVMVPSMGIFYVIISLIVIIAHFGNIPHMFAMIFEDAFNFRSIFSEIAGSCLVYGLKRGLYSNEAGSAPNASASAYVTHPVKQGLVQTVSVYIDTLLLCTATGLMCLFSDVGISADVSGAPYVQHATATVFGSAGPIFIAVAMVLFAFTTLIGNLYYVDNALIYLNHRKIPSQRFMRRFYFIAVIIIFIVALIPADAAWAIADITMGLMTIINLPCCVRLSGITIRALKDYENQKKVGLDPMFTSAGIGLDPKKVSYWQ